MRRTFILACLLWGIPFTHNPGGRPAIMAIHFGGCVGGWLEEVGMGLCGGACSVSDKWADARWLPFKIVFLACRLI